MVTWFAVPKQFNFSQGGEMDPHGDVGPHLERQKLQDLVLVEALLGGPGVRHPAFDAVLVGLKKSLQWAVVVV